MKKTKKVIKNCYEYPCFGEPCTLKHKSKPKKKTKGNMKDTINALFVGIKKYNNAKTAKEGFGALENLIYTGMEEAKKKETKLEEMLRLRQPFGYNQAQGGRK